MKKLLILITFMFIAPNFADAHPGRTAGDGCHYCRTNCGKWGVPWGVRHCHTGVESLIQKVTHHQFYGQKAYYVRKILAHQGYKDRNTDTQLIVYSHKNSGFVQEIFCHFAPEEEKNLKKMTKVYVGDYSSSAINRQYMCNIAEMKK